MSQNGIGLFLCLNPTSVANAHGVWLSGKSGVLIRRGLKVQFLPRRLTDFRESKHTFKHGGKSLWEGSLIVYQHAAGSTPVTIA